VSKKPETKSGAGSAPQGASYVYDFLYHDARRVGSILSQLGKFGHLQGLKHRKGTAEGSASKAKSAASGGVPAGVLKLGADNEHQHDERHDEALESSYDPLWLNALDLYEKLDEFGLLVRDLSKARIGQFVLATGDLAVIDLGLLKGAWSAKTVKELLGNGAKAQADQSLPYKEKVAAQKQLDQNTALMFELLPILPHAVQANIWNGSQCIWATLSADAMVTSATELILRHGVMVSGVWNMLGILDAIPGGDGEKPHPELGVTADQIASVLAFGASPLGQAAIAFQPMTRFMAGRPSSAFAMTPVLIFREVSGE
jgi:hypothetical protein